MSERRTENPLGDQYGARCHDELSYWLLADNNWCAPSFGDTQQRWTTFTRNALGIIAAPLSLNRKRFNASVERCTDFKNEITAVRFGRLFGIAPWPSLWAAASRRRRQVLRSPRKENRLSSQVTNCFLPLVLLEGRSPRRRMETLLLPGGGKCTQHLHGSWIFSMNLSHYITHCKGKVTFTRERTLRR